MKCESLLQTINASSIVTKIMTAIKIAVIKILFIMEVQLDGKRYCQYIWLHRVSTEG